MPGILHRVHFYFRLEIKSKVLVESDKRDSVKLDLTPALYNMISELLVIFLVSVLLLFGLKSRRKVPPGPPQVPILGSIPFLKLEKGVGDYFLDECVTRNKISTVAVGPRFKPFIINDFELAKVPMIS